MTSPQIASESIRLGRFPQSAPAAATPASRLGVAPAIFIVLLAFLVPVSRVFTSTGSGDVNLGPADALLPVLLLLYARVWLHSGWLGWWLLAIWVCDLISWALSISLMTPLLLLREVVKVLTCFAYALVGFAIAREQGTARLIARALSVAIILIALGGLCAYFTGTPRFFVGNARVIGTFNDPNAYGVYLAMLFPIVASLPVGWAAVPILTGGIIASLSRTGIVAMGLSMLLSLGHVPLRRYLPLVIACTAALAYMYGTAQRTDKTSNRLLAYQESLGERQYLWGVGYQTAGQHPYFGIGRGNWEAATKQHIISHNTFLQVAAQSGFIGLLVMFVPLCYHLLLGLRRRETRAWAVPLAVALAGGMAVSFDNFRPFWLFVGLLSGRLSIPPEAPAPQAAPERARIR